MHITPNKIIFSSLIKRIKISDIEPQQSVYNLDLIKNLKKDIKEKGMICPLVISRSFKLIDGHHRFMSIKDSFTSTDCYVIDSQKEVDKFFSLLNSYVWFESKGGLDV